jgi:hypothetical protein
VIIVEYLKQYDGVAGKQVISFIIDIEFFIDKEILWFQTPRELPPVLKSEQPVEKGKIRSFLQG